LALLLYLVLQELSHESAHFKTRKKLGWRYEPNLVPKQVASKDFTLEVLVVPFS